jgi:16S rRNA (guanine527-N7)-methyltransferase
MIAPAVAAPPLMVEDAVRLLGVSRETAAQLGRYLELLATWNRTINLVAASTLADPWRRHVLDSGQLLRFVPPGARRLVDLGSGAGLPGLILAILGVPEVHLIEGDRRKAAFLRDAVGRLRLPVQVHAARIEAVAGFPADIVTARALAPLPRLLELAAPFIGVGTRCLFLEGRGAEAELTEAGERWTMRAELAPSFSAPDGRILILDGVQRAG